MKPVFYKNVQCYQHPNFQQVVGEFLAEEQFTDILEIGTAYGGFTMFLKDTLPAARVVSYDPWINNPNLADHGIEFRNWNPFSEDYRFVSIDLIEVIATSKKLLVVVDGNDKIKEFNTIAPLLRKGNYMMCHDYIRDEETFKTDFENKIWNWHEVAEKDIEQSCYKYSLVTMYPQLNSVVWQCKYKLI